MMKSNYKEMKAEVQEKYPGLFEYLGNYIRNSFAIMKNPKQLLPTIVLGVIWLVLGFIGTYFQTLPLPLWILSFLAFAQGGLYGGILSAVGGIVGKVVVAAFLNAMIVPLFSGQKPFSGVAGGVSGVFRGAALQGLRDASPLIGGAGIALVFYGFMNSRQDMQEAMVGIVAILMLLKNLGTKGGFMTGLLFSAAKTFSGGRIPSHITVERILSGMTMGFTLAVALTMLPFRPCVWLGVILLVVSLILSLTGKNRVNPHAGNNHMPPRNDWSNYGQGMGNGTGRNNGTGRMNMILMFLAAGMLTVIIVAAGSVNAYAEQWMDPWEYYEVKDIKELYPCLREDKPAQIRVMPICYSSEDFEKSIELSENHSFVIDLKKGAKTEYSIGLGDDASGSENASLNMIFTGDPSSEDLMTVDATWQGSEFGNTSGGHKDGYENCRIFTDEVTDERYPHVFSIDVQGKYVLMLDVIGIDLDAQTVRQLAPNQLDWEKLASSDEYKVRVNSTAWTPEELVEEKKEFLGGDSWHEEGYFGGDILEYILYDKSGKNKIVSQYVLSKIKPPQAVFSVLPKGKEYPHYSLHEDDPKLDFNKPNYYDTWGIAEADIYISDSYKNEKGKKVKRWGECDWELKYTTGSGEFISALDGDDQRWLKNVEEHFKGNESINGFGPNVGWGKSFYLGNYYAIARYEDVDYSDAKYLNKQFVTDYEFYRKIPEVPLTYYVTGLTCKGKVQLSQPDKNGTRRQEVTDLYTIYLELREQVENTIPPAIASAPVEWMWTDPIWHNGYNKDKLSEIIGSGQKETENNKPADEYRQDQSETEKGKETDTGSDSASGEERQETNAGGDTLPIGSSKSGSQDRLDEIDDDNDHEYLWDHHVGPMDSTLRTLISVVLSIIFAGGVSGTLGGGIGGAIGGAAGGFPGGPGGDGGWPGDTGPYGDLNGQPGVFENEGGIPGDQNLGEVQQRDPYHWDNPMPKGWNVDSEGDISYKDPATGEKMKYILTGYDPNTGEPQYLSEKSGFTFGQSTLRENYDDRSRNAGTLSQDYETGKRWQQEQHQQNQAKWDQERVTGKTDMSEAWKRDQQQMSKDQYLEKLAEKYGKDVNDLKGIKKEIIKNRVEAETEQQAQMAREAWLEFGEKTASQIESVADTSINVLGEVTGPAGKTIKNIYTFAKPGMSKLAEAGAKGKDVYETMTMIAQGTAEGAIGVLQNEVDGFGMAVGGDLVKTGLDGVVNGKSMDEIAADLTQTAYQSSINYGVGQMISSAGKKASQKITAGKTMEVGKNIDAYKDYGVSWKNMAVDVNNQKMAKMRLADYKKMTAQITRMENWTSAATNLFSDVYQKNLTGEISEAVGETAKAEMQSFLNNSGEMIRRYKNGQKLDD